MTIFFLLTAEDAHQMLGEKKQTGPQGHPPLQVMHQVQSARALGLASSGL